MVADQARLYRLAYGILRDVQLAEDATQQALLDIWRDAARLRDPAKYEGWSYRLLVRICYSEAKRQKEWTGQDLTSTTEPWAADVYGNIADRDQLERGFRRLSVDHRVALALRHLLGMTPEEIAAVLDLPRSTVYSRLQAATTAMRGVLEAEGRSASATLERQEAVR